MEQKGLGGLVKHKQEIRLSGPPAVRCPPDHRPVFSKQQTAAVSQASSLQTKPVAFECLSCSSFSALRTSVFTNWCKSPESQSHEREGGKMQFQPNVVILKGRPASAASACLDDRTHIFTLNEGHLYVSRAQERLSIEPFMT